MGVLQNPMSASGRVESGDAVLAAVKSVNASAIKQRVANFEKAHRAFSAAEKSVRAAEEKLRAQQAVVGEADAAQDEAVDALANALVGEGEARTNPFKQAGFMAPSRLVKIGFAEEAKQVHRLVAAVRKRKGLTAATVKAAKGADDAATKVENSLKPIAALLAARTTAMARRDALAPAWDAAFATLKRAARLAEDDGVKVFSALFESTSKPKKKAKPAPTA